MRHVIFVVPEGMDDPLRVSGGNVYDREVRDGLRRRGWTVDVREVAPGGVATAFADATGLVLVDGLCAAGAPEAVEDAAGPVVVLAHMVTASFPGVTSAAIEAERRALAAAHRVIATSRWTAAELERSGIPAARVAVAPPGTHAASLAAAQGRELLCVGVIAPHKGQDVLLDALAELRGDDWTCVLVGSPAPAPAFARQIARDASAFGGRVRMTGVLTGAALADEYARSAVVVAPSRVESAGMAIADARARGIPVIAADVGGIADTVSGGGAILVRPGDPAALAHALGEWMTDPALRDRLRREAAGVRAALPSWDDTIDLIEAALS
ncbi:glycosyltransferase family 4 protein [Microbacterium sp. ASV49]|uniref:Glycosyltransferase family 4 protein n=1 Tax=Microbacterium candidum TaxID=3041922 RepID=A0ABT7MVB5_9MICO|nr:glycosyltransferase family 4 protein [Microbacterium sp. ASV49]MDL9978402.1 glycosyltransferase family 4 protein [Microbacterium sp. ASV49]